MWPGFAFVYATPNSNTALQSAYRLVEPPGFAELSGYVWYILAYGARRFGHTAPLLPHVSPTTHQQQPVLYHHCQQFGIHLTHNPKRIAGTPLVYVPLTLPQFEQQFDLPASTSQHQRLLYAQLLTRHVGRKDVPFGL